MRLLLAAPSNTCVCAGRVGGTRNSASTCYLFSPLRRRSSGRFFRTRRPVSPLKAQHAAIGAVFLCSDWRCPLNVCVSSLTAHWASGRFFLGDTSGGVHEFRYTRSKEYVVGGLLNRVLPGSLRTKYNATVVLLEGSRPALVSFIADAIHSLTIDEDRGLLTALTRASALHIFAIPPESERSGHATSPRKKRKLDDSEFGSVRHLLTLPRSRFASDLSKYHKFSTHSQFLDSAYDIISVIPFPHTSSRVVLALVLRNAYRVLVSAAAESKADTPSLDDTDFPRILREQDFLELQVENLIPPPALSRSAEVCAVQAVAPATSAGQRLMLVVYESAGALSLLGLASNPSLSSRYDGTRMDSGGELFHVISSGASGIRGKLLAVSELNLDPQFSHLFETRSPLPSPFDNCRRDELKEIRRQFPDVEHLIHPKPLPSKEGKEPAMLLRPIDLPGYASDQICTPPAFMVVTTEGVWRVNKLSSMAVERRHLCKDLGPAEERPALLEQMPKAEKAACLWQMIAEEAVLRRARRKPLQTATEPPTGETPFSQTMEDTKGADAHQERLPTRAKKETVAMMEVNTLGKAISQLKEDELASPPMSTDPWTAPRGVPKTAVTDSLRVAGLQAYLCRVLLPVWHVPFFELGLTDSNNEHSILRNVPSEEPQPILLSPSRKRPRPDTPGYRLTFVPRLGTAEVALLTRVLEGVSNSVSDVLGGEALDHQAMVNLHGFVQLALDYIRIVHCTPSLRADYFEPKLFDLICAASLSKLLLHRPTREAFMELILLLPPAQLPHARWVVPEKVRRLHACVHRVYDWRLQMREACLGGFADCFESYRRFTASEAEDLEAALGDAFSLVNLERLTRLFSDVQLYAQAVHLAVLDGVRRLEQKKLTALQARDPNQELHIVHYLGKSSFSPILSLLDRFQDVHVRSRGTIPSKDRGAELVAVIVAFEETTRMVPVFVCRALCWAVLDWITTTGSGSFPVSFTEGSVLDKSRHYTTYLEMHKNEFRRLNNDVLGQLYMNCGQLHEAACFYYEWATFREHPKNPTVLLDEGVPDDTLSLVRHVFYPKKLCTLSHSLVPPVKAPLGGPSSFIRILKPFIPFLAKHSEPEVCERPDTRASRLECFAADWRTVHAYARLVRKPFASDLEARRRHLYLAADILQRLRETAEVHDSKVERLQLNVDSALVVVNLQMELCREMFETVIYLMKYGHAAFKVFFTAKTERGFEEGKERLIEAGVLRPVERITNILSSLQGDIFASTSDLMSLVLDFYSAVKVEYPWVGISVLDPMFSDMDSIEALLEGFARHPAVDKVLKLPPHDSAISVVTFLIDSYLKARCLLATAFEHAPLLEDALERILWWTAEGIHQCETRSPVATKPLGRDLFESNKLYGCILKRLADYAADLDYEAAHKELFPALMVRKVLAQSSPTSENGGQYHRRVAPCLILVRFSRACETIPSLERVERVQTMFLLEAVRFLKAAMISQLPSCLLLLRHMLSVGFEQQSLSATQVQALQSLLSHPLDDSFQNAFATHLETFREGGSPIPTSSVDELRSITSHIRVHITKDHALFVEDCSMAVRQWTFAAAETVADFKLETPPPQLRLCETLCQVLSDTLSLYKDAIECL
ncbi:MAG: hypothetical protein KVP17_001266 [Porospora cf. gigantea B]|uniref:uncharacterized protein n=1 Tax=Porospora cf. gigantea B TaxID=2853592 RepID=UPI003571869D|nr:MAG: hypothetical protein KVP17_001266 [Porospora cf. gigantea B]